MREPSLMDTRFNNNELERVLKGFSYQEILQQFAATTTTNNTHQLTTSTTPSNNIVSNQYSTMNMDCNQPSSNHSAFRQLPIHESNTENRDSKMSGNLSANDKRKRTLFTTFQLTRMEEEFNQNMYVVGLKRWRLATELCLTEKQVKIWFQNRRMKLKREQVKTKCLSSGFPWY